VVKIYAVSKDVAVYAHAQ